MSKFFKALDQAQRDRALREQSRQRPEPVPVRNGVSAPLPAEEVRERPADPAVPHDEERPSSPHARRPRPVEPPAEPAEGVDDHLVSLVAPAAFEAEQYRALRHLVEQQHKSAGLSVIAVSSPAVGDGKTTTAINLAGALAQAPEARVLLVDADLRRPTVDRLLGFGTVIGRGLVEAIQDRSLTLGQVVRPRPPFNLHVLLAGRTPPSPYEVLKSPRLGELLDAGRQQYDYVVLDTPPLVGVQDCRVIARWIDGLLIVVAAHRTPRRLVEEALNVVDPGKVVGLIFNGDDPLLSVSDHYAESRTPRPEPIGLWGRTIRKLSREDQRRDFEADPDRELE